MGIIISNGNGKNFSSRAQSKKSKLIDVELLKDQEKYQKIMKFLLLGKIIVAIYVHIFWSNFLNFRPFGLR